MSEQAAVKLYRDTFRLNLNQGFRSDVEATVSDLELWKEVLTSWGYWKEGKWIKHNPLNIKGMMQEYERRATQSTERTVCAVQGRSKREGVSQDLSVRVSERRDRDLLLMRENQGVHIGAGYKTLDDIVTNALQQKDRS